MPKPVEAANPYVSPPVANIEDMTQPMGPLEKGDQALVDAAASIPEGQHEIRRGEGDVTWVGKVESLGQDIAVVNTMNPDGSTEHASTLINTVPGVDGINADIDHKTAWDQAGGSRAHVSGNEVGGDVINMKVGDRRAEAQAIKLEVARKINEAAEQLGEDAVKAAQR